MCMLDVVTFHIKPAKQNPSLGETVEFAVKGTILILLEIESRQK
jgi:hypothetical protein